MPAYYTPLQTAALLGLSKNTMYKYIKDGTIRSVRLGAGRIRVPASEVRKFMIVTDENLTERSPQIDDAELSETFPSDIVTGEIVEAVPDISLPETATPMADSPALNLNTQRRYVGLAYVVGALFLIMSIASVTLLMKRGISTAQPAESVVMEARIAVDEEIERGVDRLLSVARSTSLKEAVLQSDLATSKDYLREMALSSSHYVQLILFGQNGERLGYYPEALPAFVDSVYQFDAYKAQAEVGKVYISPTLFQASVSDAPWTVIVAVPVVDDAGQVIAILAGRVNLDLLDRVVAGYASQSSGRIYLTDTEGRVIVAASGVSGDMIEERGAIVQVSQPHSNNQGSASMINEVTPTRSWGRAISTIIELKTTCCSWNMISENSGIARIQPWEIGSTAAIGLIGSLLLGYAVSRALRTRHHV